MYQFLESIKIACFRPINLEWHQARVNQTFQKFFPSETPLNLVAVINNQRIENKQDYKCRIIYSSQLIKIEFIPYHPKPIKNFKLVEIGNFEYQYKFADRSYFQEIKTNHPDVDELILVKEGIITDTTYSNLVFENNFGFFTPTTPLLPGIVRAKLISTQKIKPIKITTQDLNQFEKFYLINALIGGDLDHSYSIDTIANY